MNVRARLHLPFDQWPPADRQLWAEAFSDDDPFSDSASARLSARSKQQYSFAWRRFLGFLHIEDGSALALTPIERLTKERVRAFAKHLAETNIPRSVAIQIDFLYRAARIILPNQDLTWLKSIKARLHSAAPHHRAAGPAITSLQILQVGLSLMDQSMPKDRCRVPLSQAVTFRDGLLIGMLAFVPLRRKNLAALEIGRHIIGDGDNQYIIIPATETKTRSPVEFGIPSLLLPYLDIYLTTVRPRLLRDTSCRLLWISPRGGALSYAAVGDIVSRHTARHLGLRVTTHDTRDAAATTWALAEPEKIRVASDLLSHADSRSTDRHYNRARGLEASRVLAELIKRKRQDYSTARNSHRGFGTRPQRWLLT